MILQEATYTIVNAIEDNMMGAIAFFFLLGFSGMFLFYWLFPRFRNKTVMALLFVFMLIGSIVGAIIVWPQFWQTLKDDLITGLISAVGALAGGAFLLPVLIVVVFGLVVGAFAGRGFLSRGGA